MSTRYLQLCCTILLGALLLCSSSLVQARQAASKPLRIGVTLHAYHSWVRNIVADTADVQAVIPSDADPHAFQYTNEDVRHLTELDVLVCNGLGHDEYLDAMLAAAGKQDLPLINVNAGSALLPTFETKDLPSAGRVMNSHSYISYTVATEQIHRLAEALGKQAPTHAAAWQANARTYARRLRQQLGSALRQIENIPGPRPKIAAVHDGYAYLFAELGLPLENVVQPRHGLEPTARQLSHTIKSIREAGVSVLFTELDYPKKYADIIFEETGCRMYHLSHISNGPYTADKFEQDMTANVETIVRALRAARDDAQRRSSESAPPTTTE